MNFYGAKEIAASFRTVRNNTIKIAEEIPEDKYSFRPVEELRTVAQMLIHISNLAAFQYAIHRDNQPFSFERFDFMARMGPLMAAEQQPGSKAEIVQSLRDKGEEFASWVETLSDEFLAQVITMPPGGSPPSRSRFDMIISVKEHEMHHRAQLMVYERMLGMVPHLTQARMAAMAAAQAQPKQ